MEDPAAPAPDQAAPIEWPQPSLEQISKSEGLIRQAEIARRRGDTQNVIFMIKAAYEAAPTFSGAIVAYCTELIATNRVGEAMGILEPAHKAMPKDVPIERLFAEMVLRTRFRISDFQTMDDMEPSLARNGFIILLSCVFPGLGQLSLFRWVKGGIFLSIWLLSIGAVFALPRILVEANHRTQVPTFTVIAIAIAVVDWIWALSDATSLSKHRPKVTVERQMPPGAGDW